MKIHLVPIVACIWNHVIWCKRNLFWSFNILSSVPVTIPLSGDQLVHCGPWFGGMSWPLVWESPCQLHETLYTPPKPTGNIYSETIGFFLRTTGSGGIIQNLLHWQTSRALAFAKSNPSVIRRGWSPCKRKKDNI